MAAPHLPDRLTVLCWHNIESSPCFPYPDGAGPRRFAQQLRILSRVARVVPLGEALADLDAGRRIGPRSVALTFDDGYRDHLEAAVPVLGRLGLPATFFLVPGLLSGTTRAWWEVVGWAFGRTARSQLRWEGEDYALTAPTARREASVAVGERLKRRDRAAREAAVDALVTELEPEGSPGDRGLFLDWDGARELVRQGYEIGSHSLHHAILSEEEPEEQRRDLVESRRLLQEALGIPALLLAYPNGTGRDYDAATIAAVGAAGHSHAVTMRTGVHAPGVPPYEVHRLGLTPLIGPRELWWSVRDVIRGDGAATVQ